MAGTHALGGAVTAQTVTWGHTIAQAEAITTVIATIYVPNKATILDVILEVTTISDDGATATLAVGDSSGPATADPDRFISTFSAQATGSIRASDSAGLLEGTYTYRGLKGTDDSQTEQAIELSFDAAAATGTDDGAGRLTVIYINSV